MSDFKKMVKVHNNFVEAIYSLELTAKKLLLSVILHLDENNDIKISREELIREVGIDLGRKDKVERELPIRELMTKIITIREIDSSNFAMYQLLKASEYKDGIFYTSIYKDLLPYFQKVKDELFTKFNILNIKPLTSVYAIRIYEMCKQFENTGWNEMTIDELKKRLLVENKYSRIYDFKKWVLEVAKKQINENTDLMIDYELEKDGKRYKTVKFTIAKKVKQHNQPTLIQQTEPTEQELIKPYIGQKIYIQNKLHFFENLVKNKDANSKDYNRYILKVKDPSTGKIGSLQLENIEIINAIETIKKMMKGE